MQAVVFSPAYMPQARYAASTPEAAESSSVSPDRGDYAVKFRSTGKEYSLALVPKTFDADHRAFYMDDTGTIRAEDTKPATASSEPVKTR